MQTITVGIREFRENLSTYLLESHVPVAITRHGDTVGFFIPAPRKRTESEKTALREAAALWRATLEAEGISEDDLVADFKKWRKNQPR